MKLVIAGSPTIEVNNLNKYISEDITEIVSGGASLIDICAKECAKSLNIKYTEFLPQYNIYGNNAPLVRNMKIAYYAYYGIVFWDGKSKIEKHLIECFKNLNKTIYIIRRKKQG